MQQQITETLVNFKVAELAKKKGFELNSTCYYEIYKEGPLRYKLFTEEDEEATYVNDKPDVRIAACTQDFLQKWLREVHKIYAYIKPIHYKEIGGLMLNNWEICIEDYMGRNLLEDIIYIHGHEEAREEALFQALNLLPDKKN